MYLKYKKALIYDVLKQNNFSERFEVSFANI